MDEALILIAFLVLFIALGLFKPRIKGLIGEAKVAIWLSFLSKNEYKTLNNILIQSGGRSSQIDHVVVSTYGIYVIETKNYKGWIHGHENSEFWLQNIYKYKNHFRNPVIQCKGHVRTLKTVLRKYQHAVYYPIVVFTGQATLKNVHTEVPVVYSGQLNRTIRKSVGVKCLTREEVADIADVLAKVHTPGRQARRKHNRKAKQNYYDQGRREKSNLCPRCGGSLVLRKGKFGKFHGCSNFPVCKFTKAI